MNLITHISHGRKSGFYVELDDLANYAGRSRHAMLNIYYHHRKQQGLYPLREDKPSENGRPKRSYYFNHRDAIIMMSYVNNERLKRGLGDMFSYVINQRRQSAQRHHKRLSLDASLNETTADNVSLKGTISQRCTNIWLLINSRVTGMNRHQLAEYKHKHGRIIDNLTPLQHQKATALVWLVNSLNIINADYRTIKTMVEQYDISGVIASETIKPKVSKPLLQ